MFEGLVVGLVDGNIVGRNDGERFGLVDGSIVNNRLGLNEGDLVGFIDEG